MVQKLLLVERQVPGEEARGILASALTEMAAIELGWGEDAVRWESSRVIQAPLSEASAQLVLMRPAPGAGAADPEAGKGVLVYFRAANQGYAFATRVLGSGTSQLPFGGWAHTLITEAPGDLYTCNRRRHERLHPAEAPRGTLRLEGVPGDGAPCAVENIGNGGARLLARTEDIPPAAAPGEPQRGDLLLDLGPEGRPLRAEVVIVWREAAGRDAESRVALGARWRDLPKPEAERLDAYLNALRKARLGTAFRRPKGSGEA